MRFEEMAANEGKSTNKKQKVVTDKMEEKIEVPVETAPVVKEDDDIPAIYGVTNKRWAARLKRTNPEAYQRLLNWD